MTTFDQRSQTIYGDQYNVAGNLFIDTLEVVVPAPADAADRRNLAILRDKVKTFWIEGVLEQSLHREVVIDLGREVDPAAVEHPWERVVEMPGQTGQPLPPGRPIGATFAAMERAMLILGEPGAGKTITLLELARDLIAQSEAAGDFTRPVPVVFNLSGWRRGQALFEWLVIELSLKYQIPKRIGRPWLEQHRLLPLLDGLDEVRAGDRVACVAAINAFGEAYGLAGLAVCSRLAEYTALPVRLKLNGAIRLQPLTPAQVDDYLTRLGLDTLQETLHADKPLRELAQSPLMLNIMSLAYGNAAVPSQQPLETVEARREHLFAAYIRKMFSRKGKRNKPFTDGQMTKYLAHLGRAMRQRDQTIFFIEQLERDWLASPAQPIGFTIGWVLLFGLSFGLITYQFVNLIAEQIIGRGPLGPIVGGLAGVSLGLFYGLRRTTFAEFVGRSWQRNWPRLLGRMMLGLAGGGVAGFIVGLGLVILLDLVNILNLGMTNIQEMLQVGLNGVQILGILLAFFSAIMGSFIGFGLGNMVSGQVETMSKPGQLIGDAVKNLFVGWVVGGIYSLALAFIMTRILTVRFYGGGSYEDDIFLALEFWVDFGPYFALLLILLFGLASLLKHASLRLILALSGYLPLRLDRLLDHATDLIFLRKVGGGYIFIHRYLLEYFASLTEVEIGNFGE